MSPPLRRHLQRKRQLPRNKVLHTENEKTIYNYVLSSFSCLQILKLNQELSRCDLRNSFDSHNLDGINSN
jgi:hypothetical protein